MHKLSGIDNHLMCMNTGIKYSHFLMYMKNGQLYRKRKAATFRMQATGSMTCSHLNVVLVNGIVNAESYLLHCSVDALLTQVDFSTLINHIMILKKNIKFVSNFF